MTSAPEFDRLTGLLSFSRFKEEVFHKIIGGYAEQSRAMLTQMQEQLQKQTEQMLGAFGIKR